MTNNLLIAVITLNLAIFHVSFSQELQKDLVDSVYSMKPMIPPVSTSMLSDSITREFKILGDINGDRKV